MGGVRNPFNLAVYTYSHQNPVKYNDPDGNFVILPLLLALFEIGTFAYDITDATQTINDPTSTDVDKTVAISAVVLSATLPGGGYTAGGKFLLSRSGKYIANKASKVLNAFKNSQISAFNTSKVLHALKGVGDLTIKGVSISRNKADDLGKAFVGEGFTKTTLGNGQIQYLSKDGLKRYRSPAAKSSSYSETGIQANFETLDRAGGKATSNIHIDIE